MIEKIKSKKVHITATFGAVAIAGLILFQGSIPRDARQVKFNAISPNQGIAGTEVVITGSGFTSSVQGISGTKVNDKVYPTGNFVLIQGDVIAGPILSPDGKTLTVSVILATEKIRMYCQEKFTRMEPCKVQVKVVNAYSKESNGQYFTIMDSRSKKLTYTIEKLAMPAPAVVHAVVPGEVWKGDDVMRIRVSAPATNGDTITGVGFSMKTDPGTLGDGYQQCAYFYPTSSPDISLASDGTRLRMLEEGGYSAGYWGGSLGFDAGVFSWDPNWVPLGCLATIGGFPLAPGEHKDFTINMKMYAQNYTLKTDGTYTPPAEQSKTFNLMVKARAVYIGSRGFVIDNSPENGYDSTFDYSAGYGGNTMRMSLSTLITSDPIQIIPQSIPTPAGYFPAN